MRAGLAVVALLSLDVAARATDCAAAWPPCEAGIRPDWNRISTIKEAATRIAILQRDSGPKAVFRSIDDCYKRVAQAAKHGEALEACIAQDYLVSHVLAERYLKLSPAVLEELAGATPEDLMVAMGLRIASATKDFPISFPFVEKLKGQIDSYGHPVYVGIAFPDPATPPTGTRGENR